MRVFKRALFITRSFWALFFSSVGFFMGGFKQEMRLHTDVDYVLGVVLSGLVGVVGAVVAERLRRNEIEKVGGTLSLAKKSGGELSFEKTLKQAD